MMHHILSRTGTGILFFLALFFLAAPAPVIFGADTSPSVSSACLSTGWPQDTSDLQPDPALVFGRLDNGLRYVLMANSEPKDRAALYLNVQSGSIHETDSQRGVAHFLEHMLFNGTTHYPPGTLVEYLQAQGMGFGGDTNAHTGFDETVYNLLLPASDAKAMAEGFKVLADYARGALLLEQEVERERGIILAEKRSRDSAASRVSKQQLQFDFAGTLVTARDPIGEEEVLKTANSALLRAYYDRWYRPENMIAVVVGDIDLRKTEQQVRAAFAGLRGVGEVGSCPEWGMVREEGTDVLILPEPELGYTGLALTTVFNTAPGPDTLVWEMAQLRQYVAVTLLANRLEQLEQRANSPVAQPRAHAGIFLRRFGFATLAARTEVGRWQEGLSLLQTTLAQALQDGFTEAELARGKREVMALLEKAVQTAPTRDSRELAEEIIRKLNDHEVILSPAQEMALYGPALEKMTLNEVNEAWRQLWSRQRRLVEVVGVVAPELAAPQGAQQVREVYRAHANQPPVPWVEEEQASFPYLAPPATSGRVIEHNRHADIGVETVVLAGGVRLNIKPTDFQAQQVLLSVQFGQGKQAEPAEGLAMMAEAVIRESGIGRLNREQLAKALAGTNINLEFKVGPESFSFVGGGLSKELERLLQVLAHRLHDPAYRPEAFRRSRENLRRMYDQLAGTVEGVQQTQGERFLAGSSPEYGLASWEQIERVELAQVRDWLTPVFAQAPLEINVVGDIDPQEVVRLVSRYFGAEQRQPGAAAPAKPIVFPAGQERLLPVASSIDRALLTVAWKTDDFWDIDRTRRLNLLAAVLDDRLRVKIREELGATYSPRVVSMPSRGHAGFGLLQSSLIVAPDQAASLATVIREVAASLGVQGVSEDELRRALEPTLTSIKDIKRNNRYWMESVLTLSSRHPQQLTWPLSISEGFAAIKAEELTGLARRYLDPKQAATVIVSPKNGR
ncbi:peptidase M16 domain protein [Desulfobulbus propionicus DSM 2032]|uniref:Peptidase M16 domain protein n=1 Tax=Desulfobulbus propionicus (strain ATCC 33891 / DSM 2032 / VKM B-1956 / 1pr3) TaxID=577650 RepID=A0A7U4DQ14_DESPD|nr:M16 family metallopeptidase [Desulfobulbus propionicus]ADW18637.1 peptidase M16 domain protein [Desulfobulbus propionicus DSM 2032]